MVQQFAEREMQSELGHHSPVNLMVISLVEGCTEVVLLMASADVIGRNSAASEGIGNPFAGYGVNKGGCISGQ